MCVCTSPAFPLTDDRDTEMDTHARYQTRSRFTERAMTATIKMAPPKAAALCAACDADAIIPPPLPHSAVPAGGGAICGWPINYNMLSNEK